ncbi:RhoGAP domain containing protein, putative [Entamoeba histolytica]
MKGTISNKVLSYLKKKGKKEEKPFGIELDKIPDDYLKDGFPFFFIGMNQCIGVIRTPGDYDLVSKIKHKLSKKESFTKFTDGRDITHELTSVLLSFVKNLPSGLITKNEMLIFSNILKQMNKGDIQRTVVAFKLELRRIDPIKRKYLIFFMNFFYQISLQQDTNKMGCENIATCVFPSFFEETKDDLVCSNTSDKENIIREMIRLYPLIFNDFEGFIPIINSN